MRLWSIHPKYLDRQGLIALWRESLLAKKVLQGKTKGYRNHPQLLRFKKSKSPLQAINVYLEEIYKEAIRRDYKFDAKKFRRSKLVKKINITVDQVDYEIEHLLKKVKKRAPKEYKKIVKEIKKEVNPIFKKVKGKIEDWEIV